MIKRYETIELFGNYIYAICDISEHVPEDDIGWRYAYRRLKTEVFRVDIRTGTKTILLDLLD